MPTYSTSKGLRLTRSQIENKIREAKALKLEQMRDDYDYIFCEDCGRSSGLRFDCSHEISVKECLESGKAELAYDVDNIKVRCRKCHQKHDNNIIGGFSDKSCICQVSYYRDVKDEKLFCFLCKVFVD